MILSREQERKRSHSVLDISPTGVTILNRRIESDQIVPLLKSYASKDGVKKLTTTGVRTLQNNKPTMESLKGNMEKGRQALMDVDLPAVKDSVVDSLKQYASKISQKRDVPPDFERHRLIQAEGGSASTETVQRERKGSLSSLGAKENKSHSLQVVHRRLKSTEFKTLQAEAESKSPKMPSPRITSNKKVRALNNSANK